MKNQMNHHNPIPRNAQSNKKILDDAVGQHLEYEKLH
jgi:hypothetical protein